MKAFDEYSAYYDLLYSEKDYDAEAQYICKLMKTYGLADKSSLMEIGCGTGKHARYFIRNGFQYSGIDQSSGMIEQAKARLNQDAHVLVSDARDFHFNEKFNGIFSLFHVMSYLTTDEDILNCLKLVNAHLKPEGVFAFDCWHAPAVIADPPIVRYKHIRGSEFEVHRVAIPSFDDDRVKVDFKIWVHHRGEKTGVQIEESHLMRPYSIEKLTSLLTECGLELTHSEAWLTGQALSDKTWYATHLVKKRL